MNCKPGDLAVIIAGAQSAGLIVRCIRLIVDGELVPMREGGHISVQAKVSPAWLIDGWALLPSVDGKFAFWTAAVGDRYLRPIGNPGEDAQDETLQWLPVPSQHKEVA